MSLHNDSTAEGGTVRIDRALSGDAYISEGEGLAKRLLQSPDANVAAAARRIFCAAGHQPYLRADDTVATTAKATAMMTTTTKAMTTTTATVPCEVTSATKPHPTMSPESVVASATALPLNPQEGFVFDQGGAEHQQLKQQQQQQQQHQRTSHPQLGPMNGATAASSTHGVNELAVKTGVLMAGGKAQQPVGTRDYTEEDDEHVHMGDGKKPSSSERLQRSRERNRMHARKTRQRKKEHMQLLQNRADDLKNEQLRLKQAINEKNTASILLGMFARNDTSVGTANDVDPEVEELLKRAPEDIPDASKIPELPALILPGQHNSKKNKAAASAMPSAAGESAEDTEMHAPQSSDPNGLPDDGIDYELLSKDRSKCTPAELDRIRRERNRMHAKRTRDRKRIFMEEMEVMIRQLEDENKLLHGHLDSLDVERVRSDSISAVTDIATPSLASTSPSVQPMKSPLPPPMISEVSSGPVPTEGVNLSSTVAENKQVAAKQYQGVTADQIKTLLEAARAFDEKKNYAGMLAISSAAAVIAASDDEHNDGASEGSVSPRPRKRKRTETNVPPVASQGSLPSASPSSAAPISTC